MAKKKDLRSRAIGSAILFLLLMSACLIPGVPTIAPPSPAIMTGVMVTDTSVPPTDTSAPPTTTSTHRPTVTPRPTVTSTPPPEWVTNFAQPILDAIANRPPNFQDKFDDRSGGWHFVNYCGDWRMQYVDGELVVTVGITPGTTVGNHDCFLHRNDIDYTNFVVEVDGRFLPGTTNRSDWLIDFRHIVGEAAGIDFTAGHSFGINYEPDGLSVSLWIMNDPDLNLPPSRPKNEFNRLMVIAKGSKFAFYLNGQPFYYIESSYCPYGDIYLTVINGGNLLTDTLVAFDNFKIWDLSNLP